MIGLAIEAAAAFLPLHATQRRTCLRMSALQIGAILNFNARRLAQGTRRYVP